MKFLATRKTALVAGLLYGLCAGAPLYAEDTEIYVGLSNTQSAAEPNVLFILDTSGSMGTEVEITNPTAQYDPATLYDGDCPIDQIYWSKSGDVPSCSTSRWFKRDKLRCDNAVVPLDTQEAGVGVGFYQDRLARFREHSKASKNRWRDLSSNVNDPPHVECKADDGVHGEYAADTRLYIRDRDKNNPWTTNQSQGENWNSTGEFYTLYSGNYVNWANGVGAPTKSTRLEVVKDVVKDLIDANQSLRVGLMRFDDGCNNFGGPIIHEMADIDEPGVKTSLKDKVDSLTDEGCTPLAEAMYEALLFYRGQPVHFGQSPNLESVPESMVPNKKQYESPIEFECQKNFIVMLTDGQPTNDGDADTEINALLDTASGLTLGDCKFSGDDCLNELAEFAFKSDNATLALGNDIPNSQNIISYMVGFATDQTLLSSAAQNGGGKYYTADDPTGLATAFTKIITEIQAVNTTFTAPAVSVNAFNRVTHRKELYFTLFKPAATPGWPGNVKRFELDFVKDINGDPVDSDGDGIPDPPEILDVNGVPAVDPNTGFFKSSVTSFWTPASDVPDGDETGKGGAASRLPEDPANRKVYTNVGGVNDLSDASNKLHKDNTLITDAMLDLTGGPGEPDRDKLLEWAGGMDLHDEDEDGNTSDGRKEMGDPLHAKPVLVTYGGTEASPDITMYAITNDGYLHAFDIDDGTEVFAFVPKELLPKLKIVHENVGSGTTHNYGLDGGIETWVKDHNGNGIIETPDTDGNNDHVYLYFGQRRGGTNYYALDVTDRAAPKLLWHIEGGVAGDFLELADTWSTPSYHRIKVQSGSVLVPQDVIFFAGGYDDEQDTNTTRLADDKGRAIYMVDAATGSLLWWAGKQGLTSPTPNLQLAGMDYSIPSELRVLDVNTDGFADRIYVGDMGGQLWRFDIYNATVDTVANRVTGGVIADLQKINATATPGSADNRRFYSPPDVALINIPDGQDFLSLAVGSGYRAHPLNTTIEDRMYMIKDYDIYDPPMSGSPTPVITYSAITEDDLDDRTNLGVTSTKPRGWYIKLNNVNDGSFEGEKVLAEALTFDGKVLFTTFTPVAAGSQSACSPSQGTARLYQVDIVTAAPVQNLDNLGSDTNLTRTDRSLSLVRTGIPPEVTVLFPGMDQADPVAVVGAEKVDLTLAQTPVKTYWFQEQN